MVAQCIYLFPNLWCIISWPKQPNKRCNRKMNQKIKHIIVYNSHRQTSTIINVVRLHLLKMFKKSLMKHKLEFTIFHGESTQLIENPDGAPVDQVEFTTAVHKSAGRQGKMASTELITEAAQKAKAETRRKRCVHSLLIAHLNLMLFYQSLFMKIWHEVAERNDRSEAEVWWTRHTLKLFGHTRTMFKMYSVFNTYKCGLLWY